MARMDQPRKLTADYNARMEWSSELGTVAVVMRAGRLKDVIARGAAHSNLYRWVPTNAGTMRATIIWALHLGQAGRSIVAN
jgi:hypothetical protein